MSKRIKINELPEFDAAPYLDSEAARQRPAFRHGEPRLCRARRAPGRPARACRLMLPGKDRPPGVHATVDVAAMFARGCFNRFGVRGSGFHAE